MERNRMDDYMGEYKLFKIDEDTIKRIIAQHYGTIKDGVSLHHDYKFVLKHGDKVREDYIYSIVQTDGDVHGRWEDN